jgi:hypothetical protein
MPTSGLLDVAGDALDRCNDLAGKEREGTEYEGRNYGQNDPVLSHGLSFLTLVQPLQKLQHLVHLPSLFLSAQKHP